jgi:hypothetical protein
VKCIIKYWIAFLLVMVASCLLGQDQTGTWNWDRSVELHSHFCMAQETNSDTSNETVSVTGLKKPALGILLSAAIPGTGEFYSGSWIKGAIFLGIETGLWIGYMHYRDEGLELEDRFHDYADAHWHEEDWILKGGDQDGTHTLPETKTQQYYEMIGKYDQFKQGWDDWESTGSAMTPHRDYYETLRDDSNQELIKASYCAMIVLANHVISAFDAGWTIKRHNREIKSKARVGIKKVRDEYVPMFSIYLNW